MLMDPASPRLLGATVARLTPDQKVACSNHVGVMYFRIILNFGNAASTESPIRNR